MVQMQITKLFADVVQPGNRDRFYYDNAVTGFGLKVTPRGKKVFIFEYRIGRRTRRQTLGKYVDWTVYPARTQKIGRIHYMFCQTPDYSNPSATRKTVASS